jgi:hypothetical protein
VIFGKYYIQSQDAQTITASTPVNELGVPMPNPLRRFEVYAGPQVNYAFNDRVTAFVLYEASVIYDTHGMPDTLDPKNTNADLNPGVALKLHDKFTLIPNLLWYTLLPVNTTALNVAASISLL